MRFNVFSYLIIYFILGITQAVYGYESEGETRFIVHNASSELKIISSTDTALFIPIIKAFQNEHPRTNVLYTAVSSTELMKAVIQDKAEFDIAISSAMDLQTKLANDGYTRSHISSATSLIPHWGKWRDSIFAFTQEPATFVISPKAFEGLRIPKTRQELIDVLRENPDRFEGRVGTYDIRISGLGYLFATQDSRTSDTFWRLSEVMGRLKAKLYCCSAQMIDDVSSGELAIAYNVLGSYVGAREGLNNEVEIIEPKDFTTMMLRSAVILKTEMNSDISNDFMDHLLSSAWGESEPLNFPFSNRKTINPDNAAAPRTIHFGPGLLVFIDNLKKRRFIAEWEDAMVQ